jgi:hypothetical protein
LGTAKSKMLSVWVILMEGYLCKNCPTTMHEI